MKIFITGTGTNVGKTVISGWLLTHLKHYHYWKPIQSGTIKGSDIDFIKTVISNIFEPTYSFPESLSPHLAAKINNIKIDINHIIRSIPNKKNLIIEGAGGVFVPLNDDFMMIDLIKILNIPVIIVANSGLGTINHTCLTVEALKNRNIEILGIIMNGIKNEDNKKAIEYYGKVQVLDEIEIFDKNNWYKSFLGKKLNKNLKNFQ